MNDLQTIAGVEAEKSFISNFYERGIKSELVINEDKQKQFHCLRP